MIDSTPSEHDPVAKLVFELSKLPGIGGKTATRLAYHVIKQEDEYAQSLSKALLDVKSLIRFCSECFNLTEINPCRICAKQDRDASVFCVVEKPSDILSIEGSGTYRGQFHVLHGILSPLEGIGPEELKIKELLRRIQNSDSPTQEVIVATNPSVEGDATALYLMRLLRPLSVKVTKLAHGIPVGGQLEYTDQQTITKAIENRVEMI